MKKEFGFLAACLIAISLNQANAKETGSDCGSQVLPQNVETPKDAFESNFSKKGSHEFKVSSLENKVFNTQKKEDRNITKHNTYHQIESQSGYSINKSKDNIASFTFTKSQSDEKWYVNGKGRVTCTFPVNTASYIRLTNDSKSLLRIFSDSPLVFIMGMNGIKQFSPTPFRNEDDSKGTTIDIEPYGSIEVGLVLDFGPTSFDSFVNVSGKHPTLPIVIVPNGAPDLTKELSETAKSLSFPDLVTNSPLKFNANIPLTKVELSRNGVLQINNKLTNDTSAAVLVAFSRPVLVLKRSKVGLKDYMSSRVYFAPGEEVIVITDENGVKYVAN